VSPSIRSMAKSLAPCVSLGLPRRHFVLRYIRYNDRGEDVSHFFTNRGKMMHPLPLVNVARPTRSRNLGNVAPRTRGIR
jgi:hypothetical protein